MKSNRALGSSSFTVTFSGGTFSRRSLLGGVALAMLAAACGGDPATVDLDSGVLTNPDASTGTHDVTVPVIDAGGGVIPTPDTGTVIIDSGKIPDAAADSPIVIGTPDGALPDTGIIPPAEGGVGGTCPATCTVDTDCNPCSTAPGAVNCCDTVTSACFTSASSQCPDQMVTTGNPDAGGGGY